ncbi:MAG TPA: thiolase family protein [Planctomycetaceae bacterium]|nr:thiolase family protein [Planctomycetaceae bacterium]
MESPVIVGGVRTPFVKAAGAFNYVPAQELGRLVVRELLERLNLDPAAIDEVITGNVAPSDAPNVSRVIALRAGIPIDRVAHTVNRNCASGLEAVTQAYERIRTGQAQAVIAIGVDSMSNIPLLWTKSLTDDFLEFSTAKTVWNKLRALARIRPRDLAPVISIKQGLTDPVSGMMMGDTAEKLARKYGISREAQDLFALRSHQRASTAWNEGRLTDEVMTVYPDKAKGAVERDIGPRDNQSLESLGKLKPYFDRRWGTVTVGNSCQVTDGAVALLLMTEERARSLGLPRVGRLRGYAYAGCDPSVMGLGPVYSSNRVLKATGVRVSQFDLIEINEAFAAQVLACLRCFESPPAACIGTDGASALGPIDENKLNVNGGAIALGHPVGASGARLVLTLLNELGRRKQTLGLATMCVGGGQGGAAIIERIAD